MTSLDHFVGNQLSSIAFTIDSVTLYFDGPSIALEHYPLIVIGDEQWRVGTAGYIETFCSFIPKIVTRVDSLPDKILLHFQDQSVLSIKIAATAVKYSKS